MPSHSSTSGWSGYVAFWGVLAFFSTALLGSAYLRPCEGFECVGKGLLIFLVPIPVAFWVFAAWAYAARRRKNRIIEAGHIHADGTRIEPRIGKAKDGHNEKPGY